MKRVPLSERLRDAIREKILRGEYTPGGTIIEADLAHEHAVSKTPIREVLQILAAEGLVTVMPKKGYVVRTMDFGDVREIMDMRMLLEPYTAEAAAERADSKLLVRLEAILDEQRSLRDRPLESMAAAHRFHAEIAKAGRNQRACEVVGRMLYETARAHYVLPAMQRYMTSEKELTEHGNVLAAIASGDALRAAEKMRLHLKSINFEMGSAAFGTNSLWC